MHPSSWFQIVLYLAALTALAVPLGKYMALVFDGAPHPLSRVLGPLERLLLRVSGVNAKRETGWKEYARALLVFNVAGILAMYALQRLQASLPPNPDGLGAVAPHLAFNTGVSFATNTNWQSYGGETTMSHLTQMMGLGVQNFLSAATGIAVLVAFIRGLRGRSVATIGNFWVDLVRCTVHVLLPLSLVLATLLVSQGVVQTFEPAREVELASRIPVDGGDPITNQRIALGPVASQVAIKQLGTNGGGFYNVNSAHPLENPTPISNFLEMLSILLIPAALCFTFGQMVGDRRQGWAIYAAMAILLVAFLAPALWAEQRGNPLFERLGLDVAASDGQSGGNMEGKETRFGIANSVLWATATTAASNGSVNSMHDSYTPLGGLAPMALMQLGEVVFGGVGSGLYGMLAFVVVAVFVAGLMVGRTPEYVGKKIEPFEMKMASLVILIPPMTVLAGTALAVSTEAGRAGPLNGGPHAFSEILYAFSSAGNNNGSAFAGLTAATPFYDTALGVAMFVARFWLMIPILAMAGSLGRKKHVPATPGTLPTHTPLFVSMLIFTVLLVGALTFLPALALGPVVEHLRMVKGG